MALTNLINCHTLFIYLYNLKHANHKLKNSCLLSWLKTLAQIIIPIFFLYNSSKHLTDEENGGDATMSSGSITTNAANERMISPSVMAKYLQDELKASEIKHCDTCLCANRDLTVLADTAKSYSIGTQTMLQGDANNALCLRCNSNLNSPSRTNSPYIMKLVKSSDSVISETKSSMSGSNICIGGIDAIAFNSAEKLYTPSAKKDDLMVNPILGHHRLCDRTPKVIGLQIETEIRSTSKLNINNLNNSNNSSSNYNRLSPMILKQPKGFVDMMIIGGSGAGGSSGIGTAAATTNNTLELNNSSSNCSNNSNVMAKTQKYDASRNNSSEIEHAQHVNKVITSSATNDTAATGSTNSLWSKTSSTTNADGAKMFETFNRNLIKSIKVSFFFFYLIYYIFNA